MPGLRETGMSTEARKLFNSRVVDGVNVKLPNIANSKFATFHNKNRCENNATVFLSYLREHHTGRQEHNIPTSAIIIKAQPSWTRSKQKLSFDQRKIIFENCCDADIKDARGKRCDPMLTLFSGCQMMGTCNDDVRNGVANGTTCIFKKAVMKAGKKPTPMKLHGYWVYCVDAKDVEYLLMEWHESRFQGRFILKPRSAAFQVAFPIVEEGRKLNVKTGITFFHFPILLNHATTGHKLQGKSLEALIIAEWSRVKNWAYVVLSRVRSLAGIYLMKPLPEDIDFTPDEQYLAMMKRLRKSKLCSAKDECVEKLYKMFDALYNHEI
jgi:hypothetical protein